MRRSTFPSRFRRLSFESLETRRLLTGEWQNPVAPADVNANGTITLEDVLVVVRDLIARGIPHELPIPPEPPNIPPPFVDVNGDDRVSIADLLGVVVALRDGIGQPAPVIDAALADDTGDSNDNLTSQPAIIGEIAEHLRPMTRLTAQLDDGARELVNLNEGRFHYLPDLAVDGADDGSHRVRFIAQTAGSPFTVFDLSFDLDTQAPPAPTFDLDSLSDTSPPGDGTTSKETVTLVGFTEPGAVVSLQDRGLQVIADLNGGFRFHGVSLSPGENRIEAQAADRAGNVQTFARTISLLTTAPYAQFLIESANLYAVSPHSADFGRPIIPLYTDFHAGGAYGAINDAQRVDLDGNDPDAASGVSSLRMTWTGQGPNGYFQFGLGSTVANRPREDADFGDATSVRFFAKGDSPTQQVRVNIFRATPSGGFSQVAAQAVTLTTGWTAHHVALPSGLTPTDLHAVQFVLGDSLDAGNRTIWLDELRINTERFDPLRVFQSYRPSAWAPSGSAAETPDGRNLNIYPNRSFLYDNALGVIGLLASGDGQAKAIAGQVLDAIIATAQPDGSHFNVRNSGHALQGSQTPRPPFSQLRTLGDNAWLGLAMVAYYRETGQSQYLDRAREISDWAEANLKNDGPLKGYHGGFDDNGAMFPWRATEHQIDIYALNRQLAAELTAQGEGGAEYADRAAHASSFVLAMFDDRPGEGKFWTGTSTGDAVNTASVPLDAQLWSVLAMSRDPDLAEAIDWTLPITWAEANLRDVDGAFAGFTYSTGSTPGRVWFEGLAHAAAVYRLTGETAKFDEAVQTLEQARNDHPHGDRLAIVAASSDGLSDPSLGAIYDARRHVGATAWTLLSIAGVNPFDPAS